MADAPAPAAPQFDMSMLSSFLPLIIIFGLPRIGIDLNDPQTIMIFRGLALAYILISFVLYKVIIGGKIQQNKDKLSQESVIYVDEKKVVQDVTAFEYDMSQVDKAVRGLLTSSAISAGIHLYFKINQGIAIVPISGLVALYSAPLIRKYLRGEDLPRPFNDKKSPGLMDGLMGTDKQAENDKLVADYKKQKKIEAKESKKSQ